MKSFKVLKIASLITYFLILYVFADLISLSNYANDDFAMYFFAFFVFLSFCVYYLLKFVFRGK